MAAVPTMVQGGCDLSMAVYRPIVRASITTAPAVRGKEFAGHFGRREGAVDVVCSVESAILSSTAEGVLNKHHRAIGISSSQAKSPRITRRLSRSLAVCTPSMHNWNDLGFAESLRKHENREPSSLYSPMDNVSVRGLGVDGRSCISTSMLNSRNAGPPAGPVPGESWAAEQLPFRSSTASGGSVLAHNPSRENAGNSMPPVVSGGGPSLTSLQESSAHARAIPGSQLDILGGLPNAKALAGRSCRVAVDVDEVLGSFLAALNIFCAEEYSSSHELSEFYVYDFRKIWDCSQAEANHRVHAFFDSEIFNKGIPPIPGAREALERLSDCCHLEIVTSRQHVIRQPTLDWIERHYPGIFEDVHFGNHFALQGEAKPKSEICKSLGAHLLIDDNPRYAVECAEHGIGVLLFDWELSYPWSKTDGGPVHPLITRVKDWQEVETAIYAHIQRQQL